MNSELQTTEEFQTAKHTTICFETADELHKLAEIMAIISLPMSARLTHLANQLDKSLNKLFEMGE